MSLSFRDIPGLMELLESSREVEAATREDAWLGISHVIAGERIRLMNVLDYTALLQFESPLLNRSLPTPDELSFFLWCLSPEVEKWHDGKGWRKPIFQFIERWRSGKHGKRVRKTLKLKELAKMESDWHAKASIPFTLPDDAPFTVAVKETFEYIDLIFMDRPAGLKRDGNKAGLCYLTSWFDLMQSEYHLPTEEVWKMPLPILFSRIKAIQVRRNTNMPEFNTERDRVFNNLMEGLKAKLYTEADLKAGRVDLKTNRLRNN